MGIERLIAISITRREGVQGQASQSYPVILTDDAPNASFGSARVKRFSINSSSSVGTDFGTSSDTYKAFQRAAQQERKVKFVYIAQRDAAVATQITLTFSADTVAGNTITGSVNGTAISVPFNTSHAQTLTDLDTAITAVEGVANVTVVGQVVTIIATAEWVLNVGTFAVSGAGAPTITKATSVAGRTIAQDIADMFAENNTPYLVYPTSTNKGAILAAAEEIETRRKMLFAQSTDANIAQAGSTDLASKLNALSYARTALFFTEDDTGHFAMGLASLCLSYAPGAVAFSNKSVTGATPDDLDDTQIGYLDDKKVNMYINLAPSINVVQDGICVDGVQIHATRDIDYFTSTMESKIANALTKNPKIAINIEGLSLIEGEGRAVMNQMHNERVFDRDVPAPFNAPDPADIPSADKDAGLASGFTGGAKIEKAMVRVSFSLDVQV